MSTPLPTLLVWSQTEASLQTALNGTNQLVLQIATKNSGVLDMCSARLSDERAGTSVLAGNIFMNTISVLSYSSYVSCGNVNVPTCPSPCNQSDLIKNCV
jgi:hypothetical protein